MNIAEYDSNAVKAVEQLSSRMMSSPSGVMLSLGPRGSSHPRTFTFITYSAVLARLQVNDGGEFHTTIPTGTTKT